jgi:phosphomevalonate kinase
MKQFDRIETIMGKFKALVQQSYLLLILNADFRFYTYDEKIFTKFQNVKSKTGLGSSSGLICSLNTNIFVLLMTNFLDENSLIDITCVKQMNYDDKTCVLISAYFSNNQAQKKVSLLIIFI